MTNPKMTATEILALIKQNKVDREREAANSNAQIQGDDVGRASLKSERDALKNCAPGAHPLSIRRREKYLNRCAPDGADNASREVGYSTNEHGVKGHADAQSHRTTASEVAVNSLRSSTSEEEVIKGCANDAPADDALDPAQQIANFYEVKTDLFDNSGKGKKTTIHRAKLMIRSAPTTTAKDADVFMLDFYNRSRDINKRLKEMEVDDDPWYLDFKARFAEYESMLVSYVIPPKIAVLKEIIKDDGSSEIIGYAAGIMFQVQNQDPTVVLFYGADRYEMKLDFEFNRNPGSPIFKKGIYRDADRQHLDVDLTSTKKKFKIKTAKDFN